MGGTSALLDPTFDLLELDLIRLEAKVGLGKVYARGSVFTLLILRSFDKAKSFDFWRFFLLLFDST